MSVSNCGSGVILRTVSMRMGAGETPVTAAALRCGGLSLVAAARTSAHAVSGSALELVC